jgi:hypothetical protein
VGGGGMRDHAQIVVFVNCHVLTCRVSYRLNCTALYCPLIVLHCTAHCTALYCP